MRSTLTLVSECAIHPPGDVWAISSDGAVTDPGAVHSLSLIAISIGPSARTFASHEMKDATELAVGVTSAGFEFDRGRCRYLFCIGRV